jgi:hypothetical protein
MKTPPNNADAFVAVWRWVLTGAVLLTAIVLVRAAIAPPRPATGTAKTGGGHLSALPTAGRAGQRDRPGARGQCHAPYSPKQTCGAVGCHDYDKITQGYHFTQGKGEAVPADMAARYQWVSSPGNYGGTWCSPGPLYRYLAPKTQQPPRHDRHDLGHLHHGGLRQLSSGRRTVRV